MCSGVTRPVAFRIEQRAERRQVQPPGLAGDRPVGLAAGQALVEARHQRDEHRAVERIQAHADEVGIGLRRIGGQAGRDEQLHQFVDALLRPIVGRPQRADAAGGIRADGRLARAEPRVPQLGARAVHDGRDRVLPARGASGEVITR